jgi:hypothetical protein
LESRHPAHNLGILEKELHEAEFRCPVENHIWETKIDIFVQRKIVDEQPNLRIQKECKMLCRIIVATPRTALSTRNQMYPKTGGKTITTIPPHTA